VPHSEIILDSNSYLRLAPSKHPLLKNEFGAKRYCLYIIEDLEIELNRNPTLQNRFPWFYQKEYRLNRTKGIKRLSNQQKDEFNRERSIIAGFASDSSSGVSLVDINALAHGSILNIPIITDDKDMREMADEFEIKIMSTLELMKLMVQENHINISDVRNIVQYWSYEQDLPYPINKFKSTYKKVFGESPPNLQV